MLKVDYSLPHEYPNSLKNLTIVVPNRLSPTSTSTGRPSGISGDGSSNPPKGSSSNTGAIAGGVVGGLCGAALSGVIVFVLWRRRHPRLVGLESSNIDLLRASNPYSLGQFPHPAPISQGSPQTTLLLDEAREERKEMTGISHHTPHPSASTSNRPPPGESSFAPGTTAPTMSEVTQGYSDVRYLVTEVENLRREMQDLREASFEPPPGYQSEIGL
ncbi:hypothetical protein EIP86_005888 [Pleurotus ostreatoroseus]|nr:hypothetical protein EIP86_005888 [Pleurotus ostreatoroseus]